MACAFFASLRFRSRFLRALRASFAWSRTAAVAVSHGVSGGLDRIAALGNAVVPQIPELIGHAILQGLAA